MSSEALVQLALDALSCSQKELALRLGVSPAQISKWKKSEYMSPEMEKKIRGIANIGDMDPEFVLWAGSHQDAIKWDKLIHFLAEVAMERAETGYDTDPLLDDCGLLGWDTFHTLKKMGVALPDRFPEELDIDYDRTLNEEDSDEFWNLVHQNPYCSLILAIYTALNDVYGFYAAYVSELINDDDLELMDTPASSIASCLMDLAASKIEPAEGVAPKFDKFRYQVTKDYDEWLNIVKDKATRSGVPLRAELLRMAHGSNDALGHEAEAESLGFNATRVHPDIYMNELICGMRLIHQVLPAILKKLGIDEEFQLDESDLYAR